MPARKPAGLASPADGRSLLAVRDEGVTRRRALGLGAAAGLGAVLARPWPALAGGAEPRGFGLHVTPADFPGGGRTSRVLAPSRRFDLVGLRGGRGDVEIRVRRRGGRWSGWVPLAVHGDHAPDMRTSHPPPRASDPVWTGGSDELQLRARGTVRGTLRVHLVAVPASARRRVRRRAVARAAQLGPPSPPVIPRSAWGGDRVAPRRAASYGDVQVAFVHHTVTTNAYGPEDSAAIVLGIAKYHRDTNGWDDIGYNFLVDRHGQIFEGRAGGIDQPVIGAQAQGYNSGSTGVAVLGTFTQGGIPEAALEAVARVVGWKLSVHGVPVEGQVGLVSGGGDLNRYPAGRLVAFERISGHRDGDATSCPGAGLYAQLPEIRRRARRHAFTLLPGTFAQASLAAAARKVRYGSQAVFSGVVHRADGVLAAGEQVLVQKRGRTRWVTLARATTDAQGAWSTSVAWWATGDVRVQAAGATSATTRVLCLPMIDARAVTSRRVSEGAAVRLRGAVRPSVPVTLLVERKGRDGRWRRVTAVRAVVKGRRWQALVRPGKPGLYRVTAKAGTPAANGAALAIHVRVLRGRARAASGRPRSGGAGAAA
jgi:hypothetical protein